MVYLLTWTRTVFWGDAATVKLYRGGMEYQYQSAWNGGLTHLATKMWFECAPGTERVAVVKQLKFSLGQQMTNNFLGTFSTIVILPLSYNDPSYPYLCNK